MIAPHLKTYWSSENHEKKLWTNSRRFYIFLPKTERVRKKNVFLDKKYKELLCLLMRFRKKLGQLSISFFILSMAIFDL